MSVEVCLLARLHGIPVVAMTAPGRRTDSPHQLGFGAATELVGPWPQGWTDRLLPDLDAVHADRFHAVGAVSRYPVVGDVLPPLGPPSPARGAPGRHRR